jgi:hypothetical protein
MPTTRQNYTDRTAPSREYQTVQNQSVKTTAVWQNIETRLAGLNPHSKARLSDTGYDPEEHRQVKLKFKIVSEKQQTTKQLVERHERNQGEIQKCYSMFDLSSFPEYLIIPCLFIHSCRNPQSFPNQRGVSESLPFDASPWLLAHATTCLCIGTIH